MTSQQILKYLASVILPTQRRICRVETSNDSVKNKGSVLDLITTHTLMEQSLAEHKWMQISHFKYLSIYLCIFYFFASSALEVLNVRSLSYFESGDTAAFSGSLVRDTESLLARGLVSILGCFLHPTR